MGRKILIGIILIAGIALIAQVLRVVMLPSVPANLIEREKHIFEDINSRKWREILRRMNEALDKSASTYRQREVQRRAELDSIKRIFEPLHEQFARAIAYREEADSVQKVLSASQVLRTIFDRRDAYDKSLKVPDIPDLSKSDDVRTLQLLRYQHEIYQGYAAIVDVYRGDLNIDVITFGGPGAPVVERQFERGVIAFNPSAKMSLDQRERVQVRISKAYADEMMASMNRRKNVVSDSLKVTDIMLVKLVGDDFKIVAIDDEEQGLLDDEFTQWEFDVTPLKSGELTLDLKVGMVYLSPSLGRTKKYFPSYERLIRVEVSAWQHVAGFVVNRWEFILGTILIPLGGWLYSNYRRRKNS